MSDQPSSESYPVSNEHFQAIGAIVVVWSHIEMAMEVAICGLYEINADRGLVLTSNIGFQSRIALLRILAKRGGIKDRDAAGDMLELLKRVEQGYAKRNSAAHGVWNGTDDPTIARRMSIRAKGNRLTCARDLIAADDLYAVAEELDLLRTEWGTLLRRLRLRSVIEAIGE